MAPLCPVLDAPPEWLNNPGENRRNIRADLRIQADKEAAKAYADAVEEQRKRESLAQEMLIMAEDKVREEYRIAAEEAKRLADVSKREEEARAERLAREEEARRHEAELEVHALIYPYVVICTYTYAWPYTSNLQPDTRVLQPRRRNPLIPSPDLTGNVDKSRTRQGLPSPGSTGPTRRTRRTGSMVWTRIQCRSSGASSAWENTLRMWDSGSSLALYRLQREASTWGRGETAQDSRRLQSQGPRGPADAPGRRGGRRSSQFRGWNGGWDCGV